MPFVRFNAKMSGTKSMCPTYLAPFRWLAYMKCCQLQSRVLFTPITALLST